MIWTKNMQMKMAAISRRKSTGILLLNAIRIFLEMSTRRIFDWGEADIPVLRILFLRLSLPNPDGRFLAICRYVLLPSIVVH
jgi:hypothetical protein